MGIGGSATLLAGPALAGLLILTGGAWAVVPAYGLAMACLGFLDPVWETAVQQEVPA